MWFFPRIPLPTEVLNRPLVDLQRGSEEVVEPVVSDQLVHRAPDGTFFAGTLTDDGVLDGGAQGVELLVGLLLEQVQGAHLLAIEGGAKANQEFAVNPAQVCVGLGVYLDAPSVRKRQGLTLPQGNLGKRTHPAAGIAARKENWAFVSNVQLSKETLPLSITKVRRAGTC